MEKQIGIGSIFRNVFSVISWSGLLADLRPITSGVTDYILERDHLGIGAGNFGDEV